MLVFNRILSTAVGFARSFLLRGKYKMYGLCQVVPN